MTNVVGSVSSQPFFITEINKDDIFADLADAVPGDDAFAFSGKTPAEFPGFRHDQGFQPGGFTAEFHIKRTAKTTAGMDIDHFFLFQLTDAHKFITWYDFMENL